MNIDILARHIFATQRGSLAVTGFEEGLRCCWWGQLPRMGSLLLSHPVLKEKPEYHQFRCYRIV